METKTKTRNRNPAFPAIGLTDALDKAGIIHKKEAHKAMMAETTAKHLGSSLKSSSAQQAISAMKQYGLLVELKEAGIRKLRLSDLALKIILDQRDKSNDRLDALREAALRPKIHAELWRLAADSLLPSDEEMQHYLTLGRKPRYYPEVVRRVIENYKDAVTVAELQYRDIMDEGDAEQPRTIAVGHFVQWTSQGVLRFKEARLVTGLSDDGEWAFVEGSKAGVAVSELTIAEEPKQDVKHPPANPDYRSPLPPGDVALSLPVIMDGGAVRNVDIPRMTETAFKFFKDQLETYRDAIIKPVQTETTED